MIFSLPLSTIHPSISVSVSDFTLVLCPMSITSLRNVCTRNERCKVWYIRLLSFCVSDILCTPVTRNWCSQLDSVCTVHISAVCAVYSLSQHTRNSLLTLHDILNDSIVNVCLWCYVHLSEVFTAISLSNISLRLFSLTLIFHTKVRERKECVNTHDAHETSTKDVTIHSRPNCNEQSYCIEYT